MAVQFTFPPAQHEEFLFHITIRDFLDSEVSRGISIQQPFLMPEIGHAFGDHSHRGLIAPGAGNSLQ